MRRFATDLASAAATVLLVLGLWLALPVAASAQTPDLCGRESTIGTVRVLIACPDWPNMRAVTGFAGFPDAKGQQVFMRSSDPSVTLFRVDLTFRKQGAETTVTQFAAVDPRMDSGVGWVLGDVEIVRVRVVELRDVAAAVVE